MTVKTRAGFSQVLLVKRAGVEAVGSEMLIVESSGGVVCSYV